MKRLALASVFCLLTCACGSHTAMRDEQKEEQWWSLKEAVAEFNRQARLDRVGKSQPPLSVEEVVTAIEGWQRDERPSASDAMYEQIQKIARMKRLPEGAELTFRSLLAPRGGDYQDVWWIDLTVMNEEGAGGYVFRIREQTVGPSEIVPCPDQE